MFTIKGREEGWRTKVGPKAAILFGPWCYVGKCNACHEYNRSNITKAGLCIGSLFWIASQWCSCWWLWSQSKIKLNSVVHFRFLVSNSIFVFLHYFQIFYRFGSKNENLKQIKLLNCDPCSLTDFGKAIEKIIVQDYDEACKIGTTDE